jgi:hypothetical protein
MIIISPERKLTTDQVRDQVMSSNTNQAAKDYALNILAQLERSH